MYEQSFEPSGVTPPSESTEGLKSLKDLIRIYVINCNDKVRQFYVSRLIEPIDLKTDLIGFIEDFADLFLNTSEILRHNHGKDEIEYNNKKKTVNDWCDLADSWLQMEKYDEGTSIQDIFRDGTAIYKVYLKCLVEAEMYEV